MNEICLHVLEAIYINYCVINMIDYIAGVKAVNFIIAFYGSLPERLSKEYKEIAKGSTYPYIIYITHIGVILALFSIGLGIIKHIKKTRNQKLIYMHKFFTINGIGIESIVTFGYWTLYFMNPVNVNNPALYNAGYRRPFIKEFSSHIYPIFALFFEGYFVEAKRESFYYYFLMIFGVVYYTASAIVAKSYNGEWQYGFLTKMSTFYRIGVFCGFIMFAIAMIEVFIILQNKIKKRFK